MLDRNRFCFVIHLFFNLNSYHNKTVHTFENCFFVSKMFSKNINIIDFYCKVGDKIHYFRQIYIINKNILSKRYL